MCVQQNTQHPPSWRREKGRLEEAGGKRNVRWRVSRLRWLLLSRRQGRLGLARHFYCFLDTTGCFTNFGALSRPQHRHSLLPNTLYSTTRSSRLGQAKYSKLTLGDKFAKLIFMRRVAQLCLVTCFEEFNLKFNQAAEHDRKNCLNSQHHQILWWYHIFAFLKMNFNPSGKIWENWTLPISSM